MSVEPDDIRYKEFKRSVRGYSPDEVDDLLDSLADDLESARSERDRLSGELDEARKRIEHYEGLESSIRATLEQAEKAASDYQEVARKDAESTLENARREAGSIIRDAERRCQRMLADSHSKVERVRASYEALRQTRHSFDADFRRLLKGYLHLLDEANSSTAREIEAPLNERLDHEAIAAAREAAERERDLAEQTSDEEVSHIEVRGGQNSAPEDEIAEESEDAKGQEDSGEAASEGDTASLDSRRGRFLRRRE